MLLKGFIIYYLLQSYPFLRLDQSANDSLQMKSLIKAVLMQRTKILEIYLKLRVRTF